MTPTADFDDFSSKLQLDQIDDLNFHEIANLINNAFLEPMQTYQPLQSLPPYDEQLAPTTMSEIDTYPALNKLNLRKASGPDKLQNWLLKEFAEVLAQPVCAILNSSFRDQEFPSTWILANIAPLIKTKPVTNVSKHLRPKSLPFHYQRLPRILSWLQTLVLLYFRLSTPISLKPSQTPLPRMPLSQ